MLLTHSHLPLSVGLIPGMRAGMWGILGLNKGEGASKEALKTDCEATPHAASGMQMTGGRLSAPDLFPRGLVHRALGHGVRAAGVKATARGEMQGIGHLARQDNTLAPRGRM